jgi:hypothetical protein
MFPKAIPLIARGTFKIEYEWNLSNKFSKPGWGIDNSNPKPSKHKQRKCQKQMTAEKNRQFNNRVIIQVKRQYPNLRLKS